MANYQELNKDELQTLLEQRDLPKTGNKDELVERLEADDAENGDARAEAAADAAEATTVDEADVASAGEGLPGSNVQTIKAEDAADANVAWTPNTPPAKAIIGEPSEEAQTFEEATEVSNDEDDDE